MIFSRKWKSSSNPGPREPARRVLSVSSTRTPWAVVSRSPDCAQLGRKASSRGAAPTAPSDERRPVAAAAVFFALGFFVLGAFAAPVLGFVVAIPRFPPRQCEPLGLATGVRGGGAQPYRAGGEPGTGSPRWHDAPRWRNGRPNLRHAYGRGGGISGRRFAPSVSTP